MWPFTRSASAQDAPPADAPAEAPAEAPVDGAPAAGLPPDAQAPEGVDPGASDTVDPTSLGDGGLLTPDGLLGTGEVQSPAPDTEEPVFQTSDTLLEDTSRLAERLTHIPEGESALEAGQSTLSGFLELHLFTIGQVEITPGRLLLAGLTLAATFGLSKIIRRTTRRAFHMRGVTDAGRIGVTNRLIHYVILLIGFSLSLEAMGIHLSALFAAGAIFAVGIGFAMQNIVQNFVSGVILLLERSIKPEDVLEIDGQIVRVEQMGIRATVVRTRDEEELIVPNGVLVQNSVKNFTKRDRLYRVRASVGVAYGSDMTRVEEALLEAGHAMPGRDDSRVPQVLLIGFGNNTVDWELSVWTQDPWRMLVTRSELNKRIWKAFKVYGIEIAFPQVDLHLDDAVVDAIAGRVRVASKPQEDREAEAGEKAESSEG